MFVDAVPAGLTPMHLPIRVPFLRGWPVCADAPLGSSSDFKAKID